MHTHAVKNARDRMREKRRKIPSSPSSSSSFKEESLPHPLPSKDEEEGSSPKGEKGWNKQKALWYADGCVSIVSLREKVNIQPS